MTLVRSRLDIHPMDGIISHKWRLNEYREEIEEIDELLRVINLTVDNYMSCSDEDEYEIPPGFEAVIDDENARYYYGVYFPTNEGDVFSYI